LDKEKIYERGLSKQQSKNQEKTASQNALEFYENNKVYCQNSLSYYNEFKNNIGKYVDSPIKLNRNDFQSKLSGKKILVITANPIEKGVLLRKLSEYYNMKLPNFLINNNAYQIINTNDYTIIHSHANRTGDEFTRRTINNASKLFHIDYVLLLGICYGMDYEKDSLCSVIISNDVRGYRINFRDNEETDEVEFEAESEFSEKPNNSLVSNIEEFFSFFQPINEDFSSQQAKVNVTIKTGKILSSNSLMSSRKVKTSILSSLGHVKPKPLAGEMEACGIFKSNIFSDEKFDKWLVIKSICDWGEKKNSFEGKSKNECEEIKDSIQAFSMLNTWIVFKTIIENMFLFCESEEQDNE
jgi:nucleoside phosphorylase